jgi:Helix-turn-helix domain
MKRSPPMTNVELATNYFTERAFAELIFRLRGTPISVQGLRLWRREGKGPPAIKIGRKVLYRVAAVDEWLKGLEASPRD